MSIKKIVEEVETAICSIVKGNNATTIFVVNKGKDKCLNRIRDAVAKRFTDVPMLDSMFNSMKTTTHIIDDNRLILQIGDSNFFELIACCDDDGSGFFELISKETIDDIVGELPEEELPDEQ